MPEEWEEIRKWLPLVVILVVAYLIWRFLIAPPPPEKSEFRELSVPQYWSGNPEKLAGPPGSVIPFGEGWRFGGTVEFEHRYLGGTFIVGFDVVHVGPPTFLWGEQ